MDKDLVENVVDFYYKTVRKTLVNLKSHDVVLESLGTFKVKKKEVGKLIDKYNKHLAVLTKETFSQMSIKKDVEARLEKVLILEASIKSEKERRDKFFKAKKDARQIHQR